MKQSFVMAMSYGDKCDKKIVSYLAQMGAEATYHTMGRQSFGQRYEEGSPRRFKITFCSNSLIRDTINEVNREAPSYYDSEEDYKDSVKNSFMEDSYKYLVEYLNSINTYGTRYSAKAVAKGLDAYSDMVSQAMKWGKVSCKKDISHKICLSYERFKILPKTLKEKDYLNKKGIYYPSFKKFKDLIESKI